MPKKYLLSFTDEETAKVEALAVQHGRTPTGLLTYIARLQIGTVPEPTPLRPVQISTPEATPKYIDKPQQEEQREHRERETRTEHREEPRAGRTPRTLKPWIPNKNLAAYTEETDPGSGIFSDGKSFAVQVGPVGRQSAHFFQFIHEAEEALKKT